jgi:hypothetical protein
MEEETKNVDLPKNSGIPLIPNKTLFGLPLAITLF